MIKWIFHIDFLFQYHTTSIAVNNTDIPNKQEQLSNLSAMDTQHHSEDTGFPSNMGATFHFMNTVWSHGHHPDTFSGTKACRKCSYCAQIHDNFYTGFFGGITVTNPYFTQLNLNYVILLFHKLFCPKTIVNICSEV